MADATKVAALVAAMPDLDEPQTDSKGRTHSRDAGKLTGPPWSEMETTCEAILAAGDDGLAALTALVKPGAGVEDYRARYTVHGLAVYVCRDGKTEERARVEAALTDAMEQAEDPTARLFFVRELATCGTARTVKALAPLATDAEVGPDAVATLFACGAASDVFRTALAGAKGRARLHVVQALAAAGDAQAAGPLLETAKADDGHVRLATLWGLARLGKAEAADLMLDTMARGDRWERIKAAKAALLLAETLAAKDNAADAKAVYQRVAQAAGDKAEAYLRDAAERGMRSM